MSNKFENLAIIDANDRATKTFIKSLITTLAGTGIKIVKNDFRTNTFIGRVIVEFNGPSKTRNILVGMLAERKSRQTPKSEARKLTQKNPSATIGMIYS